MTDTEKHGGWTNYYTWAANLWISNEQYAYEETRELLFNLVREMMTEDYDDNNMPDTFTLDVCLKKDYTEKLEAWVKENMLPSQTAGLAADLLNNAIANIDWNEIAESNINDNEEEIKEIRTEESTI